jgi:predicted AAA+ superfamily ATPase
MNAKLVERYLAKQIRRDMARKMVFLGGPRQSGKTTLAKMILGDNAESRYFNWDDIDDREMLIKERLPIHEGAIVLNEIHKENTEGRGMELRYFRDVDLHEVDFVLIEDGKPLLFIECKTNDLNIGKGLMYLRERMPHVAAVQVVLNEDRDFKHKSGIRICGAAKFLGELV